MKAERRHELAENELAKVIKGAPTFWQQSGGKFLLGLIVVLLIIILIQYRIRTNREALTQATEQLSMGRGFIEQLEGESAQMAWMFAPPHEVAMRRKQAISEATSALETAVRVSDDRTIQAEAMLARGDLNYQASKLHELPGAATQPSLALKPQNEYRANAAEAYQTVINSYSDAPHAVAAAKFGLAAIHEDRGEWDAAKALYEEISKVPNQVGAYKALAEGRLALVPMLRQQVILGKATTEPALPEVPTASTNPLSPFVAAPTTNVSAATQAAAVEGAKPQATTATAPAATTHP